MIVSFVCRPRSRFFLQAEIRLLFFPQPGELSLSWQNTENCKPNFCSMSSLKRPDFFRENKQNRRGEMKRTVEEREIFMSPRGILHECCSRVLQVSKRKPCAFTFASTVKSYPIIPEADCFGSSVWFSFSSWPDWRRRWLLLWKKREQVLLHINRKLASKIHKYWWS